MDIFSNLTDDQIALLGCAAALISSGGLMVLSHYIGRLRKPGSPEVNFSESGPAGEVSGSRRAA